MSSVRLSGKQLSILHKDFQGSETRNPACTQFTQSWPFRRDPTSPFTNEALKPVSHPRSAISSPCASPNLASYEQISSQSVIPAARSPCHSIGKPVDWNSSLAAHLKDRFLICAAGPA